MRTAGHQPHNTATTPGKWKSKPSLGQPHTGTLPTHCWHAHTRRRGRHSAGLTSVRALWVTDVMFWDRHSRGDGD